MFGGERAEALVLRPDTADTATGGVPLADFGDRGAKLGRDGFDERRELLDGDGVIDCEGDVSASGVASGGHAGFAGEADGDVGADALEAVLLVGAEADAETDEKDDRRDAPDDAEHGEEAAQLGCPESGERLFEDLEKGHSL